MLEDAREVLRNQRQTVAGHQTAMTGLPAASGVEDMGIHIGDVTVNQSPAPAPPASSGLSTTAKAAMIGTALLGAGGLGAAVPLAINALREPAPAVAPQTPGMNDTDTQYQLRLVP